MNREGIFKKHRKSIILESRLILIFDYISYVRKSVISSGLRQQIPEIIRKLV